MIWQIGLNAVGSKFDLNVKIQNLKNPRKEAEEHYYNPRHSRFIEFPIEPQLSYRRNFNGIISSGESIQ